MRTMRGVLSVVMVLIGGCAPLGPEQRLEWEVHRDVYLAAAGECKNTYLNVFVNRVQLNGDVAASASADSRFDRIPFTRCYHETIARRVEQRRQAGKPVPENLNLQPGVDFD